MIPIAEMMSIDRMICCMSIAATLKKEWWAKRELGPVRFSVRHNTPNLL
jgi:hypothetical protein